MSQNRSIDVEARADGRRLKNSPQKMVPFVLEKKKKCVFCLQLKVITLVYISLYIQPW